MSKHSSRGTEWNKLRQLQLENYNYQCVGLYPAICEIDQNLQLDHIIPKSKGGEDTVENTRILCRKCNGKKQDKNDPTEKSWWNPHYFPMGAVRRPGS